MAIFSGIFFNNNKKQNILALMNPPPIPKGSYVFERAVGLYNGSLNLSSFNKFLPATAISARLDTRVLTSIEQPKPVKTIKGSRFSYVYPNLVAASRLPFHLSHIEKEQSNQKTETLVDKVARLNLQTTTFPAESIEAVHEEVEAPPVPLSLFARINAGLDLQTILLPVLHSIPANTDPLPLDEAVESSREEKLIRWILTSHNIYGLAITVLHNFFDICCQKPEERNFINESLVPRIRYTGFTISATAGVVYHLAIGVLFTPFVVASLGRKKEVNEIWYSYWTGASISAMGVFAGVFGMVSGNYLIHKTMEKSIPQFKRLLTRYLYRIQIFCTRLNGIKFPQLRQDVQNVKTTADMVSITQKLVGIAKGLLPTVILQNSYSAL
ncbi:hypothetical protein [Candidatus Rhabdochlamydia sp. T3358]|uniref:hypothetical protein n=1 Tax=Candidatus Rhabdochlamydia sp. T3358 TaxID=2099795 RepID=UPI0010B21F7E|nr:hypothetical protein [Candidatus Rhabdochlamydia sp. T3358]VHO02772.1 hypothetical protein RHT_00655 [Candidatus Rhabdochlamydia sp. T3358]